MIDDADVARTRVRQPNILLITTDEQYHGWRDMPETGTCARRRCTGWRARAPASI